MKMKNEPDCIDAVYATDPKVRIICDRLCTPVGATEQTPILKPTATPTDAFKFDSSNANNAGVQEILYEAIKKDSLDLVIDIFPLGNKDVNQKDEFGYAPLHVAAKNNCVKTTRYLINNGATINITSNAGYTPLHLAVLSELTQIVKILLLAGADVQKVDNQNNSAVDYALMRDNAELTQLLFDPSSIKEDMVFSPFQSAVSDVEKKPEKIHTGRSALTESAESAQGNFLLMRMRELEQEIAAVDTKLAEKKATVSALTAENTCRACKKNPINTVILNCRHNLYCQACLKLLKSSQCPSCQKRIKKIVKVYRS
eukprot:TRINITY_DN14680_c0_g1_i1.p1 TRINITY_DN14680_c0_g1~~TRINITY_DN14680_c0_g1_i1.p1  ORF type:complete len:366 (-),score=56.78 TRINITY_DN14680_c0_g1_i1:36-974(-)